MRMRAFQVSLVILVLAFSLVLKSDEKPGQFIIHIDVEKFDYVDTFHEDLFRTKIFKPFLSSMFSCDPLYLKQVIGVSFKSAQKIVEGCQSTRTTPVRRLTAYQRVYAVIVDPDEPMNKVTGWTTLTGKTFMGRFTKEGNFYDDMVATFAHELAIAMDGKQVLVPKMTKRLGFEFVNPREENRAINAANNAFAAAAFAGMRAYEIEREALYELATRPSPNQYYTLGKIDYGFLQMAASNPQACIGEIEKLNQKIHKVVHLFQQAEKQFQQLYYNDNDLLEQKQKLSAEEFAKFLEPIYIPGLHSIPETQAYFKNLLPTLRDTKVRMLENGKTLSLCQALLIPLLNPERIHFSQGPRGKITGTTGGGE